MGLIIRWLANTLALFIVVTLLNRHFHYRSFVTLLAAALVLGLLNTIVRPVFVFLTFPITIVTLGLFLIVINAIMLELTAFFVPGFRIESFWWAIVGAVLLSIVSLVTNRIGGARVDAK
ncbi:MAG TPA: phage holin family protein [Thermoanaerobaculia bacterium]|jgi:putative membrane protein|nr:phage holin family protein [Thermoanaerobaculia bacterium]